MRSALRTEDWFLDDGPARPGPKASPAARNLLLAPALRTSALLRRRAAALARSLPVRSAQALRLLPILFHARFDAAGLQGDAPGVQRLRRRRGWGRWTPALGLPPPRPAHAGRELVSGMAAVPQPDGSVRVVLVTGALDLDQEQRLALHLDAVRALLVSARVPVTVDVVRTGTPAFRRVVPAVLCYGALLAGTWPARDPRERGLEDGEAFAEAALGAPDASCFLALMLGLAGDAPLTPARLLEGPEQKPASELRDVAATCWTWAGWATGRVRLSAAASKLVRSPGLSQTTGEVLALGRELTLVSWRAIHLAPAALRVALRERFTREVVAGGLPRALLPALRARLANVRFSDLGAARRHGAYEIRLPDDTLVGRGVTEAQAFARALCLVSPVLAGGVGAPWTALAERLLALEERDVTCALVEASVVRGIPHDPLNAGAERALAFPGGLVLRRRGAHRPSVRVLDARTLLGWTMALSRAGETVQVRPAEPEARPVAERLGRLHAALRANPELAAEVEGHIEVRSAGRTRRFHVSRFLARPRLCAVEPEAPDLAPGGRVGARKARPWMTPTTIEVGVGWQGEAASLLYMDARGARFREVVPVAWLTPVLDEVRAVLRSGRGVPGFLSVHVDEGLEHAVLSAAPPPPVTVGAVRGVLPHRVFLELDGDRFGGGQRFGLRDAAEALLARWPPHAMGRLGIDSVIVEDGKGAPVAHVVQLWVRSQVLRRLAVHLERLWPYR